MGGGGGGLKPLVSIVDLLNSGTVQWPTVSLL